MSESHCLESLNQNWQKLLNPYKQIDRLTLGKCQYLRDGSGKRNCERYSKMGGESLIVSTTIEG